MPAYHQMGEDTKNLIFESHLGKFAGAVLSPVNDNLDATIANVKLIREKRKSFDIIFDSQLYVPQSKRGQLPAWSYFPKAVDTADTADIAWWTDLASNLVSGTKDFKPDGICSPAYLPKVFQDDYFALLVRIGAALESKLNGTGTRPLLTVPVPLDELSVAGRALTIASIVSRSNIDDIYLIFSTDVQPRLQLDNAPALTGAMQLINVLSKAGHRVLIGCSSTDAVLWKAAGAWSCASGKFFNLRRFTKSRFEEPSEGGMNLPYWLEEGLLAFVREFDLLRLKAGGRLSTVSLANPYATEILDIVEANSKIQPPDKPAAWVGRGWRQYMYWFADIENRITQGEDVAALLKVAEDNWLQLDSAGFLMEEPRNNGSWVRPWRIALNDFRKLA